MHKKDKAFTLAEVLITLGIIGVVAAMTLPALIQTHNEKATVSKLKKMYSVLQNAYNLYLSEDNPVVAVSDNEEGATTVASWFLPYLNVAKDCGTTNEAGCISGTYKLKKGSSAADYSTDSKYYKVILNDGSVIWFKGNPRVGNHLGEIHYDVNGINPPNQWGYDLFAFEIQNEPNRIVPFGVSDGCRPFNENCAAANSNGYGCAYWVIQQGNMKYLKDHNLTLN
jgi:prepilin-type N-terminal cleavage/methylation domain-containing protein